MKQQGMKPIRQRRAVALIIAVALLGVTNLIVTGVIVASGDDSYIGRLRLDAIRSEYAAESGMIAAIKQQMDDASSPLTGTISYPWGSTATITDPFDASPAVPGELTVTGTSGLALRRMSVTIE